MKLYTVKDAASQTYIKPFTMNTDRDATEGFKVVVNEEGTPYNKFPEDFELISLASFDERKGILIVEEAKHIARAIDLKENINA